ncbi:MAG TPA: hypothetical protein VFX68_04950 [Sulfuricurvum sp.]|nr:hypothetical protein [Sulfuricurvum sp.]
MKTIKQLFSVATIAILTIWFIGCAGKPITFKSVDPKSYADVKDKGRTITGSASGFQLLLLIPINVNTRHESAYGQLLAQANGDYITDVKIQESWSYAFVGTVYTTTITATAYPKK